MTNKQKARMCKLAYWEREGGKAKVKIDLVKDFNARNVEFHEVKETDTQFYSCEIDGKLIVVFRGTTNVRDAITDINARQETTKAGRIHRGFYHAFESAEPIIHSLVRGRKQDLSISFYGHSLGAALAVTAGIHLANPYIIEEIFGVGTPRVYNRAGLDYLRKQKTAKLIKNLTIIRNASDIVTMIPLKKQVIPFQGVRKTYRYEDHPLYTYINWFGKNIKRRPPPLYRVMDYLLNGIKGIGDKKLESIKDHDVNEYIRLIKD